MSFNQNGGFNGQQQNGFQGQQQNNGFQGQQQNGFQQQPQNGNFQQQPQNFGGQQQQGNFQPQGGNFQPQGGAMEMFIDYEQEASNGFGLLPNGRYPFEITAAEFGPSSSGKGSVLKLQHTVLNGEFAGRTLYENHNIQNENPTAQQIGQRDYAALCKALFGEGYREKNPNKLIGLKWVGDVDQHRQKSKKKNPDMWSQAETTEQADEPELRNRVTARAPFAQQQGQQQQTQQQPQNHSPMGGQQPQNFGGQQQQPQNYQQQPQNQQQGNQQYQPQGNGGFQQQQPQGGFQGQQQQPGFNGQQQGLPVQEQNQQNQNAGGNNQVPQGGANGNAGGNVNQPQGGFPNGGGSQFPQM